MNSKTESVYKEFQSKLKLDSDCVKKAQKLHEILINYDSLRSESPYLIAATCILTMSCINKTPKTLGEVSKILHVREENILNFEKYVAKQMQVILKTL